MCILPTFLCQGTRQGLKEKADRNLYVDFFVVCWISAAGDVSTTSFYDHLRSRNCLIAIRKRLQMAYASTGSKC